MGSLGREWVEFQQFPSTTQKKLVEFFGKMKQKDMNSLTVLVLSKGGVGKSSTVNSFLGEQVVRVSSFQVLPNGEVWIPNLVKAITNIGGYKLNSKINGGSKGELLLPQDGLGRVDL